MIYANVGDIKDPLTQNLALEFYIKQIKDMNILTEIHINHDQIPNIGNDWQGSILFCPGDSSSGK